MKFEVTYADASKVTVTVEDADLLALLDRKAKAKATEKAEKDEGKRGAPVSAVVV